MINKLPDELLLIILSFLPTIIKNEIKLVCKNFNRIIYNRDLKDRLINNEIPLDIKNNILCVKGYTYNLNNDLLLINQNKSFTIFKNLRYLKKINLKIHSYFILNNYIICIDYDSNIITIDIKNFKIIDNIINFETLNLINICEFNNIIYITYCSNFNIIRYNLKGKKLSSLKGHKNIVKKITINYKKELYSIAQDKNIICWSKKKKIISRKDYITDIVFDKENFYTLEEDNYYIKIIKWDENHEIIKENIFLIDMYYYASCLFFNNNILYIIVETFKDINVIILNDTIMYKIKNFKDNFFIDKHNKLVIIDNKKFIIY